MSLLIAETVDDLPFDVSAGVTCTVASEDRQYIFDGFKWKAEGDRPGAWIEHYPPTPESFTHCPNCVGTRVLTSVPPQVHYECEECGGGNEVLEMTKLEVEPNPLIPDESVCLEAHRIINGERQSHYGSAYVNFGDIADLWSVYLEKPISRNDVANLMIMLKIARTKRQGYHRDSYADVAGYAGCAEKIHDHEQTATQTLAQTLATVLGEQ